MNYEFKKDQFSEDMAEVAKFFLSFVKSFGPSPKKLVDRPIGIFEAMHIRFRLSLVEMGISKVIRTVMVLIVGIILYFTLFRYASLFFKLIIGGGFFFYYLWIMGTHFAEEGKFKDGKIIGKPLDTLSEYFINIHNYRIDVQSSLFPPEKKK